MKKSFIILATLAMALVSCNKFEKERQQIADRNKEAFEKYIGGTIDPEQDWNMAVSNGVTINTPTTSAVRVYASDGLTNKLVGSYNITGSETVKFDVAENVKEVYVADMTAHKAQIVSLGGTADFTSSATKSYVGASDGTVAVEKIDTYKNFNYVNDINSVFNSSTSHENASDIMYIAFNDFYIYPIYWNCGYINTIGVYYYTLNGERKEIDLYEFDQDSKDTDSFTQGYRKSSGGPGPQQPFAMGTPGSNNGAGNNNDNWGSDYSWQTLGENPFNDGKWSTSTTDDTYRSKGIHVTLPAGTIFGFYIKNNQTEGGGGSKPVKTYYSEAALNSDGISHATYFDQRSNGNSYIAFEDQDGDGSDADYNDVAFYIVPENIVPLDNTASSWTLAVEDMGAENDYDFNDIVMNVSHVSGATTAEIEIVAAGGTIESILYYKDQKIGGIHEMFGQAEPYVINTYYYDPHVAPITKTISVDPDFTMSGTYMGGFTFTNQYGTSVIASQGPGYAPYMICAPSSWKWPLESVRITNAYEQFAGFAKDHNSNTDWYNYCVEDMTYDESKAPIAQ